MTEIDEKRALRDVEIIEAQADGLDLAIKLSRGGNLRLAPHPYEVGKYPYNGRFYLWRALRRVWMEWRREHLH